MRATFLFGLALIVLCAADQWAPVIKALDSMIAREEQKQHLAQHMQGIEHAHTNTLPHDIAYNEDYSMKDLVDGIAYVEALSGGKKPNLPIFTDKDKTDFSKVEVPKATIPSRADPTSQQKLTETLTTQQSLLDNQKKEEELRLQAIKDLEEQQKALQNPLNGLPTFASEVADQVAFVEVCSIEMPNGIACPGGKCYNGKCKKDQVCYDDCCEIEDGQKFAKIHGSPCSNGHCYKGRCVSFPLCIGECCQGDSDIPKPNGVECSVGHCYEGGCVSDVGCNNGTCCNEYQKRLFSKGFPCHVSECQEKSYCTGSSAFCPETKNKEDGSICIGGTCRNGVCEKSGVVAENSYQPICTSGECCDIKEGIYKSLGTPCSNNPCMTGGACTGYSSECSISTVPLPDGTVCPQGKCKSGECIATPMCDPSDECCVNGVKVPNYNVCNFGRCFSGKCIHDVPCIGECCKDYLNGSMSEPASNGSPCMNSTGVCQDGKCISTPACVGECCESDEVSKDGKPCGKNGQCIEGMCIDADLKCTNGTCCNEHLGVLRPKGFPCVNNPCAVEMYCTGNSVYCPLSLLHKPDGTPCPQGGKCYSGVCKLPPKTEPQCTEGVCCDTETFMFKPAGYKCSDDPCKESTYCTGSSKYCPVTLTNLPDDTVCKKTDRASTDWKCLAGVCREPPPSETIETIDIDLTRNKCNSTSPCCNMAIGRVRPKGFICSVAQTLCMENVVCDGETTFCAPHVLEDGSACPGGSCVHGFCIKGIDPTDQEAVHQVHIHIVPKLANHPYELAELAELESSESEEEPYEELMTIVTTEKDGRVTEREIRIPLNALDIAKNKSMEIALDSIHKAEVKEEQKKAEVDRETLNLILADAHLQQEAFAKEHPLKRAHNESEYKLSDATKYFSEEYPMPAIGDIDPITGVARLTNALTGCSDGLCCDTRYGVFYSRGFQCDSPKNLCQMAACTGYSKNCYYMNRPDGAVCPGGNCYDGECIKSCVDECCDHMYHARPDGVACSKGFCFSGLCVSNCTDEECCTEFDFAKEDGAPCTNGFCYNGKCEQTRDKEEEHFDEKGNLVKPKKASDYAEIRIGKNNNMEEKWLKMIKKEEERKKKEKAERAELRKLEKKHQEEILAAKQKASIAETTRASLQSQKSASSSRGFKIALIVLLAGVAFLVIVAIIVAAVARRQKKHNRVQDDYYEKF